MRSFAAALVLILLPGCSDLYIIGATGIPPERYCPESQDCEGRFEIPLDRAGTGSWGDRPLGPSAPALLLRGEDASADRWPARTGGSLTGMATVGITGPFNDATRAVSTPATLRSDTEITRLPGADLVIELVLRAEAGAHVLTATSSSRTLTIEADDGGALTLALGETRLVSQPLLDGAWYHVIFELHDRRPSAIYVDGERTEAPSVPASPGDAGYRIEVGGPAAIAWLAMTPWGDASLLESLVLERFAELTGVSPALAGGSPVPLTLSRASPAFVDVLEGAARRLHLVGERWPRIACRPTASGASFCGYLAEAGAGRRGVPFDPLALEAVGATLHPSDAGRSVGERIPMITITADGSAEHGVALVVGGGGTLVISFFARAGASTSLEAQLGTMGVARFDLIGEVATADAGITAHLEPFGDGIVRCTLVLRDLPDEDRVLQVRAVVDGPVDGMVLFELAGLQLESNRLSATSLIHPAGRASDELVFGAPHNVPTGATGQVRLRALMSTGERLHDETLINVSRAASPDEQLNLYVSVPGSVLFAAASGAALQWLLPSEGRATGGEPVEIVATWSPDRATLVLEGTEQTATVERGIDGGVYDRLAIGWSGSTSGVADGLVAEIALGP